MPHFRPITDLRKTTEIGSHFVMQSANRFLSKKRLRRFGGYLVVMSIEAYEEMTETVQTDAVIGEDEKCVLLIASETLSSL